MREETILLPEGNLKRLHIDQRRLRANTKDGTNLPILTLQTTGGPYKGHRMVIHGPSVLVSTDGQLSCGARAWVSTRSAVTITVEEDRSEDNRSLTAE